MKIDSDKIVNRGLETCLIGDLKFFLNNSRFVSPLTAFLYFSMSRGRCYALIRYMPSKAYLGMTFWYFHFITFLPN